MSDNSQMQDALRDVAGSDEALRDRVKLIVMRWLSQHRVDPAALHEVTAAAVDGLGAGFAPRGQAALSMPCRWPPRRPGTAGASSPPTI